MVDPWTEGLLSPGVGESWATGRMTAETGPARICDGGVGFPGLALASPSSLSIEDVYLQAASPLGCSHDGSTDSLANGAHPDFPCTADPNPIQDWRLGSGGHPPRPIRRHLVQLKIRVAEELYGCINNALGAVIASSTSEKTVASKSKLIGISLLPWVH